MHVCVHVSVISVWIYASRPISFIIFSGKLTKLVCALFILIRCGASVFFFSSALWFNVHFSKHTVCYLTLNFVPSCTPVEGYRGVICGMDPVCCESKSWMETANVEKLSKGPNQPFYQVNAASNRLCIHSSLNISVLSSCSICKLYCNAIFVKFTLSYSSTKLTE
jgi:hypothetical protein